MRGGQITSLECALLLVGIGGLTVVIRAGRRARDMDVAQSIDVLLECLKREHGGGGRSGLAIPQLVPKPDRRRFPRQQTRLEVARPAAMLAIDHRSDGQ
jgi:hypothetical protein